MYDFNFNCFFNYYKYINNIQGITNYLNELFKIENSIKSIIYIYIILSLLTIFLLD